MITPLVVKGYPATSGAADETARMNEDLPTFGYPATTTVNSSETCGSFRSTFRASLRNRSSGSIWWTIEEIRATARRRWAVMSSARRIFEAIEKPFSRTCQAAQPTAPSAFFMRSMPYRISTMCW